LTDKTAVQICAVVVKKFMTDVEKMSVYLIRYSSSIKWQKANWQLIPEILDLYIGPGRNLSIG